MTQRQTPIGYSVYDILTRMVPGAVVLAPGAITIIQGNPNLLEVITTPQVLIAGILLLIVGESVVVLRSGIRVPPPFLEEVYKEAERDDVLDSFMRIELWLSERLPKITPSARVDKDSKTISETLEFDFRRSAESELNIDFETHSAEDIYHYLCIYLEDDLTRTTRRRRSLYVFVSNLRAAAILSVFLYGFLLISSTIISLLPLSDTIGNPWIYGVSFLLSLFVLVLALLLRQMFLGVSELYVKSLLREFRMQSHLSEPSREE